MILYYTHNAKPPEFTKRVYDRHKAQAERVGQRFVAVVNEWIGDGDIVQKLDASQLRFADIYLRIMRGLDHAQIDDFVYLVEDDVLYPDTRYFWELPLPRRVTYNLNIVYLCDRGYFLLHPNSISLSQLMGSREAMRYNIDMKLKEVMAGKMKCFEPGRGQDQPYETGSTHLAPSIDFRTDHNASWSVPDDIECFQDLEAWGDASELWNEVYKGER